MNKQQFLEKSLNKILTSKYTIALALALPTEVYNDFIKEIAKVIHLQLSECWDMAGEEWKQATQKAIKHGILPIPNRYGEYVHITDHNRVIREMETIINSLTSQKEEKENLISLKDMIDEK